MPQPSTDTGAKHIRPIEVLAVAAGDRKMQGAAYAGELTAQEAWSYLQSYTDGVLVDVRSQPEWQFTGEPNLSGAAGKLLKLSWKTYPNFTLNQDFAAQLSREVPNKEAPLFFLCRSGGRSYDAANAMAQQGYRYCFNVIDGYEGEADPTGHRGTVAGWKALGLPWIQG